MWANRNSGDFLSKSGEVKLARAMKGDNSESRRESGGAGGGMGRFLGGRIFFIGTSGEGTLEGVDDLNLTCLGFDFMGFNSIGIFFAGVLFRNFSKDGEATLFFLCVLICVPRPPEFLHDFPHFPQIY